MEELRGRPGVMFVRLQQRIHRAKRRPLPQGGTKDFQKTIPYGEEQEMLDVFSLISGYLVPWPTCLKKSPSLGDSSLFFQMYGEWVFVE